MQKSDRKFVVLETDQNAVAEGISIKSTEADIQEITQKQKPVCPLLVDLDFGDRPELFEAIHNIANSRFRSVEQQILFVLNNFCKEYVVDSRKRKG